MTTIRIVSYNLNAAEQLLCTEALLRAGNIVDAARLLGITRHALKRRIIKHNIPWPRPKVQSNLQEVKPKPSGPHSQTTPTPVNSLVVRASERVFTALESLLPPRIHNEDLGDAREDLINMEKLGAPVWKIWAKFLLIIYWTLLTIFRGPNRR